MKRMFCALKKLSEHIADLAVIALFSVCVVSAQEAGSSEIKIMFMVFKDISDMYITFAYGAMILIFAVGMVKSGLTAQAAKQFGMAGKVSDEFINVLGGIFLFVIGMLSFFLAKEVVTKVTNETGIKSAPTVDNLKIPGL